MVTSTILAVLVWLFPLPVDACTQAQPCTASNKVITFYVPHNAPNCRSSMEGCVETSRPGLDGQRVPRSLDDVRAGRSRFVTLASDASNYGKYFMIGTITYTSAQDRQKHTVQNVIGYVHDTGGAFRGRPDKIDVNTTICQNCTDAQASALAAGKNVSFTPSSGGLVDSSNGGATSGYGNALTGDSAPGAGTAPSAGGGPSGTGQSQPQETRPTGVTNPSTNKPPFEIPKEGEKEKTEPVDDEDVPKHMELQCEKNTITWRCGQGSRRVRAYSRPLDRSLITRGATEGSIVISNQVRTQYRFECWSEKKKLETRSCTLSAQQKNSTKGKSALFIESDQDAVRRGGHVRIRWSAVRVKSCDVRGDGLNEKGTTGDFDTEALMSRGEVVYTLSCISQEGTALSASTSVTVN